MRFIRHRKTHIDREHAESLLFPLAMLLSVGGIARKEAEAIFGKAYRRAFATARRATMEHIGHPTPYADIMGLWTKDRRFVNHEGRPSALPAKGRNSLATLVREASPTCRTEDVLKVLLRYGNIRRQGPDRYRLVKPYFTSESAAGLAFEPIAYFLSDASTTLRNLLNRRTMHSDGRYFWRKVETANLSPTLARRFSRFARARTLTFLEELDDWLDAHKTNGRRRTTKRRVGIGVFSIYSDPETDNPAV